MATRKKTAGGSGIAGPQGPSAPTEESLPSTDSGLSSKQDTKQEEPTKGSNTGKKTSDKKKSSPPSKKLDLAASVRKYFPQYSYLLDNQDMFGRDVIALMRKAVGGPNGEGAWTAERFAGALQRTNYWQTTVAAAKQFDALAEADKQNLIDQTKTELRNYTDLATVDEATIATFARDMARRGIKGDQLRPLAYKFAFDQGEASKAAQEALYSQNAQQIRQTAALYGQRIDDQQVEDFLTKGETAETMQRKYVAKLKAQYPQLTSQLDAGLTFDDITSDYKRIAAQILEKPADSIDFMDPKYMEAIAESDGKGGYRQLSLGEWQKKLKIDDRYGYSKTTQAVQDARALASSIARSFGKVI